MSILKNLFKSEKESQENLQSDTNFQREPLSVSIKENINTIKKKMGNSSDIITNELVGGENKSVKINLVYTEGLIDKNFVQDFIIETLAKELRGNSLNKENCLEAFKGLALPLADVEMVSDFDALFTELLSGITIILIDGYNQAITISSKGWADRGVNEPSSQTVVRGPKDGFSETLRTNTSLIRRRIKDPNLWIESRVIGRRTKTDVAIAYIKGIVNDKTVEELYSRLDKIDTDAILESGYIEDFIEDKTSTPFPTVLNTERPDVASAALLGGRIVIIVDGTPFVLIVPALFVQFYQASEDYYHRFDISSAIRLLRFVCFLFSFLVPAAYVAVTTFHQEIIPTTLLTSLAAQREGVPFPAAIEALLMEITFEVLREAGVRMPRAIGSAMSIVGALVLGQVAVEAGIVSPIMVIVVSFTAICSFVSPNFNMAISMRMIRFIFLILASTFGLFGIALGLITMILHLTSLRSFGIPYLYPMAPFNLEDQKDSLVRFPHKAMFKRPALINKKDIIRHRKKPEDEKENSNNDEASS